VVDETTADLDIDRGWTPPVFGADAAGVAVLRVGSLGKTVWGGLRIGWIRADVDVIRRLAVARSAHDLGTPELEQAIAEALVERLDDIIPQRSALLRDGREAVLRALATELPGWRVPDAQGGVSLWVDLQAPLSAALVMDARLHGVLLSPGPRFAVDGGHERRLRIPFTAAAHDLERAVAILAGSWDRVRTGAPLAMLEPYDAVV
jgi:DNA-binding transcriptional MocR family regulator